MIDFRILLFDGFETLDAMGPAEVIGRLPERYHLRFVSLQGGLVTSTQGVQVQTESLLQPRQAHASPASPSVKAGGRYVLLVPGGRGTRSLVNDDAFTDILTGLTEGAWRVLTVCTGSALLARTGLLDGLSATTNKIAFEWVRSVSPQVQWMARARWVRSGHIYTSSGISAGIDMTLGFVADTDGEPVAREAARQMEYVWNADSGNDPFAGEAGA